MKRLRYDVFGAGGILLIIILVVIAVCIGLYVFYGTTPLDIIDGSNDDVLQYPDSIKLSDEESKTLLSNYIFNDIIRSQGLTSDLEDSNLEVYMIPDDLSVNYVVNWYNTGNHGLGWIYNSQIK